MALAEILGQEQAINFLKKLQVSQQLGHAYIFSGLPGIGKYKTAFNFAKLLNCKSPTAQNDCCETCLACRKMAKKSHPDYHEVRPDGQFIKIEQIRELPDLNYMPFEGNYKVYIIIDADKMNLNAANAFLKTLEEPTPKSLFILVTSAPFFLPATILSRCQLINFKPIHQNIIAQYLRDNNQLSIEEAHFVGTLANGSFTEAFKLIDSKIAEERRSFLQGLTSPPQDSFQALELAAIMVQYPDKIEELLEYFLLWVRDLLVFKQYRRSDLIINQDCLAFIETAERAWGYCQILEAYSGITEAKNSISRNYNMQLVIERLFLKLTRLPYGDFS